MSEPIAEPPLPGLAPQERHMRLQVDAFCVTCGYNLHSLEVVRDERLGICVCRCPECGRFHPAGVGVTAAKTWAQRSSTILLVVWVMLALFATFWIIMGMGAVMVAHVDSFSYLKMISMDGHDVEYTATSGGPVLKGTTQPVKQYRNVATLDPPDGFGRGVWDLVPLIIDGVLIGFVTGLLLVSFLWHWKRRRYFWMLLLPLAVAGFVAVIFILDDTYILIHPWIFRIVGFYALIEAAFMALGIRVGRAISRGLLNIFVPPGPRQHLAFLWRVDGKTLPLAGAA
jgi:hypothetical protein